MADGQPAGTLNGQNLIAPTGNSFLDGVGTLANVLVGASTSLATAGGTFLDKVTAFKVAKSQKVQPPMQEVEYRPNDTKAAQMQSTVMMGVYAVAAVAGLYVVYKMIK